MPTPVAVNDIAQNVQLTLNSLTGYIGLGGIIDPDERIHMKGNIKIRPENTGSSTITISTDLLDENESETDVSLKIETPNRVTAGIAGNIIIEPGEGIGLLSQNNRTQLNKRVAILDDVLQTIRIQTRFPAVGVLSGGPVYLNESGNQNIPYYFPSTVYDRLVILEMGSSAAGSTTCAILVETAIGSGIYAIQERDKCDGYEVFSTWVPAGCRFGIIYTDLVNFFTFSKITFRKMGRSD